MKKRMIVNTLLASILLIGFLSTAVQKAQAIDQNKQACIDPYSCFWGITWGVWQEGQYAHTKGSNSSTFYYLSANSRGWSWSGSSWFLDDTDARDKYWGTQTANTFISEWGGLAITKHSARKHPGGNWGYLYTSEQSGWDALSCWLNANSC